MLEDTHMTKMKKILAVALCVLLDVFQREGNVGIWSALMRVLASALVL